MEVQPQVKTAIKELPTAERVVAVALKNIYDQIKQLHSQEKKEIDANHMAFIDKFKDIQKKASTVIKGESLTQQDLGDGHEKYLGEEEKTQKSTIMGDGSKINGYWLKVMKNTSFGTLINESDEKILQGLESISTNVTADSLEMSFQFSETPLTTSGTYLRKLTLNNGEPVSYDGDLIPIKQKLNQGLFETINTNTSDLDLLASIFGMVGQIINEVVPYSLEYYLGTCQNNEDVEDEFEEEFDDEEDEENGDPEKKVKE